MRADPSTLGAKMTEVSDPIAVCGKATVEIETVRRDLQRLYEELAKTNDSAKEIARNELCKALIQRLALAE